MRSVPKTLTHKITSDTSIIIEVDYGESPFNTVNERDQFLRIHYKFVCSTH